MTNAEIEAFIAVCEQKSISKAAEKLFISQSSLSTKIKTLEKEIGCPLIIRAKGQRTVSLTAYGQKFLELSVKYREIVSDMLSLSGKHKSVTLRVSSFNSLGTYIFAPVYEKFMSEMPDAILEVQDMDTFPAYRSISEGLTDMAFTVSEQKAEKILSCPAFSESMVFVCSKQSPFPDIVDISMLDLKNEIFIDWCFEFSDWHKDIFGERAMPQIKLEIMSQLEFFISKKNYWAIVPSSVAHNLKQTTDIKICHMSFDVPKRINFCVYIQDKTKQPLINCFIKCLKEVLTNMQNRGIGIEIHM